MIYCLSGKIIKKTLDSVVISCGGVGYCAQCPASVAAAMPGAGAEGTLYTVLNVSENDVSLYGFATEEQQNCFRLLTGVSGVGPKAALSILSVAPPDRLALAIITGDEKLLMQAPGIGKKIAQRIVLELRDKMSKEQLETAASSAPVAAAAVAPGGVNHTQEAVAALMVLGYSQAEALHAMEGLDTAQMAAEDIIRQCLKKLVRQ